MKTFKIQVCGRVQGVNLRAGVRRFCEIVGLNGIISNKQDGSVEIFVQCTPQKLEALLDWLNSSPGFSNVEKIIWGEFESDEIFRGFKILRKGNFILDKLKGVKNLGKKEFLKL